MLWNFIEHIDNLSVCPWCKIILSEEIEITKSGRKKIQCNQCGCEMFESSRVLWYKIIPSISQESKTNMSKWYNNEKVKTDSVMPTSSGGSMGTE